MQQCPYEDVFQALSDRADDSVGAGDASGYGVGMLRQSATEKVIGGP